MPKTTSVKDELRGPINKILGYGEMLGDELQSRGNDQYLAVLEKIKKAARDLGDKLDTLPLDGTAATATAPSPPSTTSTDVLVVEPKLSEPTPRPEKPIAKPKEFTKPEVPEVASGEYVAPAGSYEESAPEGPTRVLVVDDVELNRSMLSKRLLKRGFEVELAEGGKEAIAKLADGQFDLVLLDIMMPEVSGYDVLKEARKTKTPLELPIIMATAKDQGEDIVSAFELGANDYITKPIDFPVAFARIDTQLSRKRAMQEARRLAGELERHNQFIRKTFGRYLSREVVESILSTPEGLKLGGEKRSITIMMSDLRGFSALSEKRDPEEVVHMLNAYLGKMADIVTKHNGTIDEFIGDAILALFGAPIRRDDDPDRAIECAIEMQLAMKEVNAENRKNGFPELEMGIALNTGECVVGNIGSQKRAKYGVVGSHVNLTGRIESYTVGGQILISKSTVDAASKKLALGDKMELGAKGFKDPVPVFELLGVEGDAAHMLPARSEELKPLVREITLEVDILEGKHVKGKPAQGKLQSLSMSEARLTCEQTMDKLQNIRMRLNGLNGVIIPGDLYAKVTTAESDHYLVRFTSVPDEIKSFLRSTLANETA